MAKTNRYFQQRLVSVPEKLLQHAKGAKEKGRHVAGHFGGPSPPSKATQAKREHRNPCPDGVSVSTTYRNPRAIKY